MGSKIIRTLDQRNGVRPIQSKSIPTVIKYYTCSLSLVAAMSMGYLEHQSNSNIKNSFQILLMILSSLIVCLTKINKLLQVTSILTLILCFIPYLNQLMNVTVKTLLIGLFVIVFGQFKENSGVWMMLMMIARIGGGVLNQTVLMYSHHKPSYVVKIVFGGLGLMTTLLVVTGIHHTRSKHPLPIDRSKIIQYLTTYKKALWYGLLFCLLSLGLGTHEMNGISISIFGGVGFILPMLLFIWVRNLYDYRFYILMVGLIVSLSGYMGQGIGEMSYGLLEGIKIMILLKAIQVQRRLGCSMYFIGCIAGMILPMYFDAKRATFKMLETLGVMIVLIFMVLESRMHRRQYQRIILQ